MVSDVKQQGEQFTDNIKAYSQRTTHSLCCGIKEDLVSLRLKMTLARMLTLAKATR